MTEERREAAERLLLEANVLRLRRQFAEAETRCREALELSPEDLGGMEMLAELLHEKGDLTEARDLCQRILDLEPGRPSAEKKLGLVILELDEIENQRMMAQALLASGATSRSERKRRVSISLLLSLLWAGAGQFYNGEHVKAAILAGVFLIGLVVGGPPLLELIVVISAPRFRLAPDTGWRAVFGIVALLVYVYSLIDAPVRAQKLSDEPGTAGLI